MATNDKGKMIIATTSRMDGNYSVTGSDMGGYVRIVGYSADSDPFTGTSGDILNVTLNVSAIMQKQRKITSSRNPTRWKRRSVS